MVPEWFPDILRGSPKANLRCELGDKYHVAFSKLIAGLARGSDTEMVADEAGEFTSTNKST